MKNADSTGLSVPQRSHFVMDFTLPRGEDPKPLRFAEKRVLGPDRIRPVFLGDDAVFGIQHAFIRFRG